MFAKAPLGSVEGNDDGGGRAPDHMAELGSATVAADAAARLSVGETRTLADLDAALRRLCHTPERFGLDEVTGEPIPFARLELIPWALRAAVPAAT